MGDGDAAEGGGVYAEGAGVASLAVPDLFHRHENPADGVSLGYIAINNLQPDNADFVVEQSVPIGEEKVMHFGAPFTLKAFEQRDIFASLGGLGSRPAAAGLCQAGRGRCRRGGRARRAAAGPGASPACAAAAPPAWERPASWVRRPGPRATLSRA